MKSLLHFMPIVAGAILATQLVVETKNQVKFGGLTIAFMAFSTAAVAIFIWAIFKGQNPFPTLAKWNSADWYLHFGGLARVLYLCLIVTAIPKLGPGCTFSLAVVAQVIMSLSISHFGWLGMPEQKLDTPKLVGALFLVVGIFMVIGKR